jgi:hypothetical protein
MLAVPQIAGSVAQIRAPSPLRKGTLFLCSSKKRSWHITTFLLLNSARLTVNLGHASRVAGAWDQNSIRSNCWARKPAGDAARRGEIHHAIAGCRLDDRCAGW